MQRERERFITSKPLVITTIIQDDEMENMPKLRSYLILKKIILLRFRISSIIHGGLGLMLARPTFSVLSWRSQSSCLVSCDWEGCSIGRLLCNKNPLLTGLTPHLVSLSCSCVCAGKCHRPPYAIWDSWRGSPADLMSPLDELSWLCGRLFVA